MSYCSPTNQYRLILENICNRVYQWFCASYVWSHLRMHIVCMSSRWHPWRSGPRSRRSGSLSEVAQPVTSVWTFEGWVIQLRRAALHIFSSRFSCYAICKNNANKKRMKCHLSHSYLLHTIYLNLYHTHRNSLVVESDAKFLPSNSCRIYSPRSYIIASTFLWSLSFVYLFILLQLFFLNS